MTAQSPTAGKFSEHTIWVDIIDKTALLFVHLVMKHWALLTRVQAWFLPVRWLFWFSYKALFLNRSCENVIEDAKVTEEPCCLIFVTHFVLVPWSYTFSQIPRQIVGRGWGKVLNGRGKDGAKNNFLRSVGNYLQSKKHHFAIRFGKPIWMIW